MTQSSQQGGLARRSGYDVLGLAPSEFFRMNPFSLLELSFQLMLIVVPEAAAAVSPVGAAGATPE